MFVPDDIWFCNPPPFTSSNNLIVIVLSLELIEVVSYSILPVSQKLTISPTLNTDSSVTDITVWPAASKPEVVVTAVCSYAVALAHIETPIVFPCVPAVLAVHSPTEPWPLSKSLS